MKHLFTFIFVFSAVVLGQDSWKAINNGLDNLVVHSIAIDHTNSNIMYVSTDNGIYKSRDAGESWVHSSNGITNLQTKDIALNYSNPQILYVGTSGGGIFKSTNSGDTWKKIGSGLPSLNIPAIAIDKQDDSILYCGPDSYGIYKSSDSGNSWTYSGTGRDIRGFAVDYQNKGVAYAATVQSLRKTTNAGSSWNSAGSNLPIIYIVGITMDPNNSNVVYCGPERSGVWKTTNAASSWFESNDGIPSGSTVMALAVSKTNSNIVYMGTNARGVFKSTDGGDSWATINDGLPNLNVNLNAIAIDPNNSDNVFVGVGNGGLFRIKNENNINFVYNQIDASTFPTITSYVTVQDDQGNSILGLNSSNFVVTENSHSCSPIQVSPVSTGGGDASFALVIDRSGSMDGGAIRDAKQAAINFVNQLGTNDRAAIISFAGEVSIDQNLTSNKNALIQAINEIDAVGATRHYDAVIEALDVLSSLSGQKAIISLTDGEDTDSNYDLDDCIQQANIKNIPIFTIGLVGTNGLLSSLLTQLASETGGQYYSAPSSSDLAEIYQKISNSIQNQYQITYSSPFPQTDCSTRQVEIEANYAGASDSDTKSYQAPCSQETNVAFDCPSTCYAGSDFWLDIQIGSSGNPVADLFGASFILNYQDTQWLDVVSPITSNVVVGSFWGADPVSFSDVDDPTGKISMGISRTSGNGGVNGYGVIARVHFVISSSVPNSTTLTFNLTNLKVIDSNGTTIPVNTAPCQITVQSGSYVWPGDTNNSGYVDQADVLPIGMYFQSTGAARSGASNSWTAQLCSPWANQSAMYADCNGSGKVDQADIMAIGLNWHKSHTAALAKTNKVDGGEAVQCRVEPLDEELNVYHAVISANDVQSLMGLSLCLTAEIGKEYIDLQSVMYDGVLGQDIIHFESIEPETQSVYVGVSRKGGSGSFTGSGDVCQIRFAKKSNAPEFFPLSFKLIEVQGATEQGETINFAEQDIDYTVSVQESPQLPNRLVLYPNHPNPFNPTTTIVFEIPEASNVRLDIVNINGKTVQTLVNEHKPAGAYSVQWDATDDAGMAVASGVYLYRLVAGDEVAIKKLLFAK